MNSLKKTNLLDSPRNENIGVRQEVPTTSVVKTDESDRDVTKVPARGGARRKVLPPIMV